MTDLLAAVEAAMVGDAPAITFGRRTLTRDQLARRIRAVAASLQRDGLAVGDRVLFSIRPGIDAVVAALGVVKAGGTVVFADPGAGDALFRSRMQLAAPRWVMAESLLFAASRPLLRPLARSRGIDLPDYARIIDGARFVHSGTWLPGVPRRSRSLASLHRQEGTPCETPPDTDALIIFTSGTTDTPKAVVHTRSTLGAGLADVSAGLDLREGQRVLTDQLMIGIPALIAGAHWVMPRYGLDPGAHPGDFLKLLEGADAMFLTPASLDAVLAELGERTLPGIELIALGGAPVLTPLLRRTLAAAPNARVRAIYGMTEMLPVAIADGADKLTRDPAEGDWLGRIVSSVDATVTDDELRLAGPGLARAYLHQLPEELDTLATGDLARIADGELTMLGRRKDMLIRDRTNIYPGLYEPIISDLPGVREAFIIGVPDSIGDDRVVLALIADDDSVPARVERALPGLIDHAALPDAVVRIATVPRSGRQSKPDRAALAAQLAESLG